MATIVYIDGFNLYYGALKGTAFKWLDLETLSARLLPGHAVVAVKYYTARVSVIKGDHGPQQRQQVYLRALETLPRVYMHYGHFLVHKVRLPLATPRKSGSSMAWVLKYEEKGSDVNLATHLVADGYEGRYDTAVVISNDSDLAEPIKQVKETLGLQVGIFNPHPKKRRSAKLASVGPDFHRQLNRSNVRASQFPDLVLDGQGRKIHKPPEW